MKTFGVAAIDGELLRRAGGGQHLAKRGKRIGVQRAAVRVIMLAAPQPQPRHAAIRVDVKAHG